MREIADELWFKTERTLSYVDLLPSSGDYDMWMWGPDINIGKLINANTNKKVSTNKTFHSYWCGVSPLLSSVSLVIRRFLLLLPTPPLLRLKYEEAMDRTHAQKWMIKIWMLRMQTNTKKKSPVLQQLRPPVPVMPHLGSTGWREEGVWLIQSLVRFDSKSQKTLSHWLTFLLCWLRRSRTWVCE